MKYQIIRKYNGTKGYGKKFDTQQEARDFLRTDPKVQQDKEDGFGFTIEAVKD